MTQQRAAAILETIAAEQGWGYYRKLAVLEEFCQGSTVSVITEVIDRFGYSDAFGDFLHRKADQHDQ